MLINKSLRTFFTQYNHFLFTVSSLFALNLVVFRSLVSHMTTNLFDWNDYPLYVWILYQNIFHLKNFDFVHFFEGNIFYPHPHTLLFSDLFLPQSIVALVLSFFINNPILVFNIVFLLTIFLNGCAAYYFWQKFAKSKSSLFFATFATLFSGFIFQNWVHFQILSLWPFLFAAGWLLQRQYTVKRAVIGGLLMSVTLYSSVYLWVFLVTILALWYLIEFVNMKQKNTQFAPMLVFLLVVSGVFLLTSGYTIYQYQVTRDIYQAKRDYSEYVRYSLHLSDYLFPPAGNSLIWQTSLGQKWAHYNNGGRVFPGFVLVTAFVLGVFSLKKIKNKWFLGTELTKNDFFFLTLLLMGFIFSLGPRLNVNGVYLSIPLPYTVILKINPLFEVVRVTARWVLFCYIGLVYFSIKAIEKIRRINVRSLVVVGCVVFTAAEVIPTSYLTRSEMYSPPIYEQLTQLCRQTPQVLMEYPLTQFFEKANIVTNLSYRTQMMDASLFHHCLLVNGYTGYIPSAYEQYENRLVQALENKDKKTFFSLLKEANVQIFKLNKSSLFADRVQLLEDWMSKDQHFQVLHNEAQFFVVKLDL